MKVGFRVDASRAVGTGHLMRCLTLAKELAAEGVDSQFVGRADPAMAMIAEAGFALRELPVGLSDEVSDAAHCRGLLDGALDWLVVDHYGLGETWERAMRQTAKRLAAIDDLARAHDVDLLLDQNEVADGDRRYAGLLPADARVLLGARYALLRPEFIAAPRERDGTLRRVLVSFGGSDPPNATSLALDALVRAGWTDRAVDVVIGRLHAQAEEIAVRCGAHESWTLHVQTPRLGELMSIADVALGAGGTSTWERCASGLPALVVTIAHNQRALAQATAIAGACRWLGDVDDVDAESLADQLLSLEGDAEALRAMSRAARALCDGRGTRRVARVLLAGDLTFRVAVAADEGLTLEWRNHPAVRQFSGDSRPIVSEEHRAWLARVLDDPDRALLIALHQGQPLAVVRFDDLTSGAPEISVYLDPARHGAGWATEVLIAASQWLRQHHPVREVRARIHGDNGASQQAFHGAGFRQIDVEAGFARWLWRPDPVINSLG